MASALCCSTADNGDWLQQKHNQTWLMALVELPLGAGCRTTFHHENKSFHIQVKQNVFASPSKSYSLKATITVLNNSHSLIVFTVCPHLSSSASSNCSGTEVTTDMLPQLKLTARSRLDRNRVKIVVYQHQPQIVKCSVFPTLPGFYHVTMESEKAKEATAFSLQGEEEMLYHYCTELSERKGVS